MRLINAVGLKTTILFLVIGFLIGFILRSFFVLNQAPYSNDFEIERIQQGDRIRDMILIKKVPYDSEVLDKFPLPRNVILQFKGEVQLTGDYFFDAPMGAVGLGGSVKPEDYNKICMSKLGEQSLNKLPRPTGKGNDTWFCFDNNDYAFKQFGPVGNKGRATVVIDNYTINKFPGEVGDTATLVRVEK